MTVDLYPRWVVGSVDLTEWPFGVDADSGVEVGEPDMIVEGITSGLVDGDLERTVRHGNREYVIPMYVEGPTLLDVAESEALLRAEIRKTGLTLTHDPGDGFAPTSVYEVQTARLSPDRDDPQESHLIRKFTLTLVCGPWARSEDMTTVAALAPPPVTPTTAPLSNADTTAGWSALKTDNSGVSSAVTVTDEGASVKATASGIRFHLDLVLTTASTSTALTPYLQVEMSGDAPSFFYATLGGVETLLVPLSSRASTLGMIYVFDTTGAAITKFRARVTQSAYASMVSTLQVHDVTLTNTLPQISSRQISRTLTVGGTERTPASIRVAAANGTDLLSTTIVHTAPEDGSGYSPPLRRWRTSGNTTSSGGPFSGTREPIHPNPVVAKVPTSSLPEGGYQLAAFMRCTTAATVPIYWTVGTIPPGGTRSGDVSARISWTFTANVWQLVPLGIVSLPTVRTMAGQVQVDILRDASSSASVEIDDPWLFRIDDDCALSIVNVAYPNLWLDSPDVTTPVPTVWVGTNDAGRTHPGTGLVTMGTHVLSPGGTALFTASSNTDNPAASATFYDRFHSNAAK